jgi:hypothetical protein
VEDTHHSSDSHHEMSTFLTGYAECAEEALWYLTEVEKLPQNHPTVVGLKMHLNEQYRMFQIKHLLPNALYMSDEDDTEADDEENDDSVNADDTIDCVPNCAIYKQSVPKCENTDIEYESLKDNDTNGVHKNNSTPSFTNENKSSIPNATEGENNESESELSPEAHMVAVALAEEIYALLQSRSDAKDEQNEEVDYSTDTDIESVDEGFDESIEA